MLIPQFRQFASLLPELKDSELGLYERHYELLRQWNEKMNLVSRKSIDAAFANHYADSVQIAAFAYSHIKNLPVFDLGTGAGFPGLIFAIRYPETRITLFEKSLKKQTFLSAVVSSLELSNVEIMGGFPDERFKAFFFARAVFPREELFQFFLKRALPGSLLVANLGGSAEVGTFPKRLEKRAEKKYALPGDAGERRMELFSLCST